MSMPPSISLDYQKLRSDHIPLVMPLELEAYPDPWTQGMFQQETNNGASHFYVVFANDQILGYGGFWFVLDEAHITKVTIASPFRGQGYGRTLMAFLIERVIDLDGAEIRLEVREGNTAARHLYESLGFESVGLRKGYYARTNETAVVMKKSLFTTNED